MKLITWFFFLIASTLSAPQAGAEKNHVSCRCKCAIHWFTHTIRVTGENTGLPPDATRGELIDRAGTACQSYCEARELADYGRVIRYGFRSGVCW